MKQISLKKLIISGIFLSLCIILPYFTGHIPQIGKALSPMHIPVLICGFICGAPYGCLIGFLAPFLGYMINGMPPIMPTGLSMAFEIATYGAISGFLYHRLPKKAICLYVVLILSMIAGRVVWGIASLFLFQLQGKAFTFELFLSGAFFNAIPGIVCHILIIPPIVIALRKSHIIK